MNNTSIILIGRSNWTLEDYKEAYGDVWDEIPSTTEECAKKMEEYIHHTYDENLAREVAQEENCKVIDIINNVEVRLIASFDIIEDLPHGFPFSIGGVTLTSKDGKRGFALDPYSTDFTNGLKRGGKFNFESKLEIDTDVFEDCNYELTVLDLIQGVDTEFYFGEDDLEFGEIERTDESAELVMSFDGGILTIPLKLDK